MGMVLTRKAGKGVAVDSSGDVFLTGFFVGEVDFGGGVLGTPGVVNTFVAKFSGADGAHVWSIDLSGTGGRSAAADLNDNVIVVGGDVAAKLSGIDGALVWSQTFVGTARLIAIDVAQAPDDDSVVVGLFSDTADFGKGPVASVGGDDIFVVRLSAVDGSAAWTTTGGGLVFESPDDVALGVTVTIDNDVAVTGFCDGSADFGGGLLPCGVPGAFVVKFSGADGAHLWSTTASDSIGSDIAAIGTEVVVVASFSSIHTDFGGGPLLREGGSDMFCVRLGR